MDAIERFKASSIALLIAMACLVLGVGATARPAPAAGSVGFFFYSPNRAIECRFSFGAVACADFRSSKVAILNDRGAAQITTIKRFGTKNRSCHAPPGDYVQCWFQQGGAGPTLHVGTSATDPDDPGIYRCGSRPSGIVCRSLLSRRGFSMSDESVVRLSHMTKP